jgi:hypothetical protein
MLFETYPANPTVPLSPQPLRCLAKRGSRPETLRLENSFALHRIGWYTSPTLGTGELPANRFHGTELGAEGLEIYIGESTNPA